MYKLNNIPLLNYGIFDARANNSNIALSGFLDMPERLGKTFHDWSDEQGIEPYVLPEEIYFGGRTLIYHGLLKGGSKEGCVLKLQAFYNDINAFNGLVTFESPWSTHQVYVKDEIQVTYLQSGWAEIRLYMREPVVNFNLQVITNGFTLLDNDGYEIEVFDSIIPQNTANIYHIDFVSFSSFGAFLSTQEDNISRSGTKEANFIAYNTEGYQITKEKAKEISFQLVFKAQSLGALQLNINRFLNLLAKPGLRTLNIDNTELTCFCDKGFELLSLKVLNNISVAVVQLQLRLANANLNMTTNYMNDSFGNSLIDASGNFIQFSTPNYSTLTDSNDINIIDHNYELINI